MQVSTKVVCERVAAWLMQSLAENDARRRAVVEAAWSHVDCRGRRTARGNSNCQREIAALERQAANLAAAIAAGGDLPALVQKLQAVEASLQRARAAQAAESDRRAEGQKGILSREDVAANLLETLHTLLSGSRDFAAWMRRLLPTFVVRPVQALDSGQVRPRAVITVRWADIAADAQAVEEVAVNEDMEAGFDLFEPPLHIRYLPQCMAARQERPALSLKGIARILGLNHMTVKRAFDYDRRMQSAGLTDPYRDLEDRPIASRWRRRRKQPPSEV